jgi:ribosomal protein L11 methyltransferase
VSYTDQRDDPILEPAPGEFRLWPHSRLQALFPFDCKPQEIVTGLAHVLRVDPARIAVETLADRSGSANGCATSIPCVSGAAVGRASPFARAHAGRGDRAPRSRARLRHRHARHHRHVPGWLDEHAHDGQLAIDYGCGSGVLAVAARELGAREAHAFDIDPQALTATRDNAAANDVGARVHVVERDADLPDRRRHPAG